MALNNTENIYSREYDRSYQPSTAADVPYDNSESGLAATNVQGAIDEIEGQVQQISAPEASDVAYDNSTSGMTADDVQEAVDELNNDIESITVNSTTPLDAAVNVAAADFPYTFGSDGYFHYVVTAGTGYVKYDIANGADGSNPMQIVIPANASYNVVNTIAVKKGMRVSALVDASNLGTYTFRPFIMEND